MKTVSMATLLVLLPLVLLQCSENIEAPIPGPGDLPWGESRDATISSLSGSGWTLVSDSNEAVVLSYPVSRDQDIEASDLFAEAEKPEEPYTLTLFFKDNALTIARVQRRDTSENVAEFLKKIKQAFSLKEAAVDSPESSETTEAGNVIKTKQQIFETDDFVLKLNRTTVEPAEEKMKGGLNDQIEIQLFPKARNEGISAEALSK